MSQPTVSSVEEVIVPPVESGAALDPALEKEAFLSLSDALARSPDRAVQRLVDVALKLTGSDAAGVSLEQLDGPEPLFRWVAVAGSFERYLDGTMPRYFSPCGEVLARGRALVMRDPARCFPYIGELHVPIRTALLVPFPRRGKLVGTLWVLSERDDKAYSVHDQRLVESLTTFSSAILDALAARAKA